MAVWIFPVLSSMLVVSVFPGPVVTVIMALLMCDSPTARYYLRQGELAILTFIHKRTSQLEEQAVREPVPPDPQLWTHMKKMFQDEYGLRVGQPT